MITFYDHIFYNTYAQKCYGFKWLLESEKAREPLKNDLDFNELHRTVQYIPSLLNSKKRPLSLSQHNCEYSPIVIVDD